jgi:hypothetical protein
MAHHSADETPPGAAAPPVAVVLPGGPNGTSRLPPPSPAGLGLTARRTALRLVPAASAVGVGPKARGIAILRPRGSSKGRKPAAAPAARIADPADLVGA